MELNHTNYVSRGNKFFKEGHYRDAISSYEKAVHWCQENGTSAFLNSLNFNISLCKTRLYAKDYQHPMRILEGRNGIVLIVNPSHAHLTEIEFWNEFIKQARSYNYAVIDLNFRKVPEYKKAFTFIHPARLIDLSKKLSGFINDPMPPWANDDLIDLYVDWEHRRWQIEKYSSEIRNGCICLINYVDYVIRELNPAVVFTTNKIDPPNHFAYLASKFYGIAYRFVERSPLDSHLIENNGMFYETNVCEDIISQLLIDLKNEIKIRNTSDAIKSSILGSPYGFRESEAVKELLVDLNNYPRPLFFLPLDNLLWTGWAQNAHPQGNLDYPIFRDAEKTLDELNNIVTNEFGGTLLIKPHPSCKEWNRLRDNLPQLNFTESDLDALCNEADVILSFLTKVSYLGLAKGKPVVSFGAGLLDYLGVTYQVKSPNNLKEVIKRAQKKIGLNKKIQKFSTLLPYLKHRYFPAGSTVADEFTKEIGIADCRCNGSIPKLISNTLNRSFQKKTNAQNFNCIRFETRQKEKNLVIFDVSRLLNAKLRFSGVSRYIEAVARQLIINKKFNVILGYFSQKNNRGMSGFYFNELKKRLSSDLFPLEDAFNYADGLGKEYIYHSPINPLPKFGSKSLVKRVITIHDVLHMTCPKHYQSSHYITPDIIRSIDLECDAVVFVSKYSMKDFEKLTDATAYRKAVIHLAVDHAFQNPDFNWFSQNIKELASSNFIIFPCQGDPRKGFERMVNVSTMWLNKDFSKRKVVVFGSEANRKMLYNLISKCDATIRSQFVYFTNLSDERLAALYNRSRAQLYLSEAEGFGLPPLEAMASGCPSIMLANTSLREIYEDWPLMLNNDASDDTILESLDKLTTDNVYYSQMSVNAQHHADKFRWFNTATELTDFYQKILEQY